MSIYLFLQCQFYSAFTFPTLTTISINRIFFLTSNFLYLSIQRKITFNEFTYTQETPFENKILFTKNTIVLLQPLINILRILTLGM